MVLSDFGLAAYLPTSSDTLRGPFCGTRGYTAPECSEADSLFSHEADVLLGSDPKWNPRYCNSEQVDVCLNHIVCVV